jgi:hypothetical protein
MVDVPAPVGEKEAIFPLPEAASPVPVLLLLQLKDVVPGLPVKVTALVATPTQRVWSLGSLTDAEQHGAFILPMVMNCLPGSAQANLVVRQDAPTSGLPQLPLPPFLSTVVPELYVIVIEFTVPVIFIVTEPFNPLQTIFPVMVTVPVPFPVTVCSEGCA